MAYQLMQIGLRYVVVSKESLRIVNKKLENFTDNHSPFRIVREYRLHMHHKGNRKTNLMVGIYDGYCIELFRIG